MAKLPRFLDIDVNPFDRADFEVQVEEGLTAAQEQAAIREQIESTIRWRRVNEDGLEVIVFCHFIMVILYSQFNFVRQCNQMLILWSGKMVKDLSC